MDIEEIGRKIGSSAQLASLLEVSGYPKPGNVHRTRDFPDTRYEHFLAGSVAMRGPITEAAKQGAKAGTGELKLHELRIGDIIKKCVNRVKDSHKGGNTHLGTILLFVPLSAAAGKMFVKIDETKVQPMRKNLESIMKSTTPEDSVDVCRAIKLANDIEPTKKAESWEGKTEDSKLSLTDPQAERKLVERDINLSEWMKSSSAWDGIARELTSGMEASFETGYPALEKTYQAQGDINVAVVHTFLEILSNYPDTFIARKVGLKETDKISEAVKLGMKKAEEVSTQAKGILEAGGLTTEKGRKKLDILDRNLQESEGKLNPGTTADLTASSIMIALLLGMKY